MKQKKPAADKKTRINRMNRERERRQWKAMRMMGKRYYLLRKGAYHWLWFGLFWVLLIQLIDKGFTIGALTDAQLPARLLVGITIFPLLGLLQAWLSWRRMEKKYGERTKQKPV